ncbi:PH domain-containing protein [Psychrobacter urativorans]|uniref:PH domain-containing protein n=1 Tax=Psychrobacter urativorans TaxID=45610 RepID=UPI00191863F3|nr:PH domain-containing protein [Psychrobacter urativorans]
MTDIIFASKIDTWLTLVFIDSTLLMVFSLFVPYWFNSNTSLVQNIFILFLPISFTLLLLWLPYCKIQYTVTNDQLLVNNGFSTSRINLKDITSIQPSSSFLAAPALFLDRIEIAYKNRDGNGGVLISPKDKPASYNAIQVRTTTLQPNSSRDGLIEK